MRRAVPWLVLLLLLATAGYALLLGPAGSRPSEPAGEDVSLPPTIDGLTLVGRGPGEPDRPHDGRLRPLRPDLRDLGSDDPPFEIVVLDDQGNAVPQVRVAVSGKRMGTYSGPAVANPIRLGRRWLRDGAEIRIEAALDASGKAMPFRPLVVPLGDPEATRVELRLDRGRDLEVRVVDEQGDPVAGVPIHVASADPNADVRRLFWNTVTWTSTDRNGIAPFLRLPAIDLVVTAQGEEDQPLASVEVGPQTSRTTLGLRLGPTAIEGRVLESGGAPLAGIRVEAKAWVEGQDARWHQDTDREGRFRIRGIPAGADVRVEALTPDPARLCSALLSDVRPGTKGIELRLERSVSIRLEVVDGRGRSSDEWIWDVEVRTPDGDAVRYEPQVDPTRPSFLELQGLRPGPYLVEAHEVDPGSGRSRTVQITAPADGIRLVVDPAPGLTGHVEGARGARYDAWWTTPTSKTSARVDPDGSFEIKDVGTEVGTLYVGSTSTNRYALIRGVRPGSAPIEVTLVEGERVSGRVEVASGAHPGLVYVVLAGDGFELWEEMSADGTFVVLGVPPGSYDVSLSVNEKRGPTLERVRAGATDVTLAFAPPR